MEITLSFLHQTLKWDSLSCPFISTRRQNCNLGLSSPTFQASVIKFGTNRPIFYSPRIAHSSQRRRVQTIRSIACSLSPAQSLNEHSCLKSTPRKLCLSLFLISHPSSLIFFLHGGALRWFILFYLLLWLWQNQSAVFLETCRTDHWRTGTQYSHLSIGFLLAPPNTFYHTLVYALG